MSDRGVIRPDGDELEAVLWLRALPGLSDSKLHELVTRYGSARAALSAPAPVLGERAASLRDSPVVRGRIESALRTIDRLNVTVLTRSSPSYPERLAHLHDPPFVLFARGRLELLERPIVAIVGSRRATTYGLDVARLLAGDLARAGLVVVSGMARGIDGAAHVAALEHGTIGVLGCGVDVVYPTEHGELHRRVAEEGLLLSEFLPGTGVRPFRFPQRNRILAALAAGVVVVEASEKSGALITAAHALELGREVFAVPGPIGRPTSVGSNRLIQDGAALVADAADVLDGLGFAVALRDRTPGGEAARPPAGLDGRLLRLWESLEPEPRHVDEIARGAGLASAETLVGLLELELRGHARQLPGMRFGRAVARLG